MFILTQLIFTFVLTVLAATDPHCDFCNVHQSSIGGIQLKMLEPPPGTSNIFSSLVLDESRHFYLKITRGAFVPFYFLIISKEHFVRTADLTPEYMDDLVQFKHHVEQFFEQALQEPYVVFEHGPTGPGCRVEGNSVGGGGGCVDHLHLHILPFSGDIENSPDMLLKTRFESPLILNGLPELSLVADPGKAYILYENPSRQLKMYPIIDSPPSQLLRLLIAEELKVDDEFNWREFADKGDFFENAAQSAAAYTTWKVAGSETARRKIRQKKWNNRVSGERQLIGSCLQFLDRS